MSWGCDIDGMLFECFATQNLDSHFMFSSRFMLFPTFLETRGLSA